jgi:hypothetical protein
MSWESSAYKLIDRVDELCVKNCQFKYCEKCHNSSWNRAGRETDLIKEREEREERESQSANFKGLGMDWMVSNKDRVWSYEVLQPQYIGDEIVRIYRVGSELKPVWLAEDQKWLFHNPKQRDQYEYLEEVVIISGDWKKWRKGW